MTNQDNPFNLKCIFCGRPLILGQVGRGGSQSIGATGYVPLEIINQYNLSIVRSLGCPSGHNYNLNEVNNFQYEDLSIEESLLNQLGKEIKGGENFTNILKRDKTKVYVVNYGFFGRIRFDRLRIKSAPSPSNHILDKIKIFICSNDGNGESKTFIFSCVPEKVTHGLNNWTYKVVYYESL